MAASPSLSHSSQVKAMWQRQIEINQEVSDECGSGVVRVVQEAQSIPGVCVLCVQNIARLQSRLLDPSTSEGRRARLEEEVQECKGYIQGCNADIAQLNSEMAELVEERAAIFGKGEPPGCHANGSQ